jgi:hypothetical protein
MGRSRAKAAGASLGDTRRTKRNGNHAVTQAFRDNRRLNRHRSPSENGSYAVEGDVIATVARESSVADRRPKTR